MKLFEIKFLSAVIIMSFYSVTANAQSEFKTDMSISEQLKNGTAPGLKFAPLTIPSKLKQDDKNEGRQSSIRQIINGSAKGLQFKSGGISSTKVAKSAKLNSKASVKLPSDEKTTKTQIKIAAAPSPSMQEEKAKE